MVGFFFLLWLLLLLFVELGVLGLGDSGSLSIRLDLPPSFPVDGRHFLGGMVWLLSVRWDLLVLVLVLVVCWRGMDRMLGADLKC